MILYNGTHSVDFFGNLSDRGTANAKNTWIDWHIVPTSKLYVAPAEPNFNFVAIPGSNRILDLSDYLTGDVTYAMRSGEWEFVVDLDYWQDSSYAYSFFLANLHGAKLYCELQDFPETVYSGRFAVGEYSSSQTYPILKIKYNILPIVKIVTSRNSNGTDNYSDETTIESGDIEVEVPVIEVPLHDS